MAGVAAAVGFLRSRVSVKRNSDGAISDGVDVNLEALAI